MALLFPQRHFLCLYFVDFIIMIDFVAKTTLLLLICSHQFFPQMNGVFTNTEKSISETNIKRHMQFLASDIFEGRGTGTTGGNLAAKYIALEYSKYGLKPCSNENNYYQYIPMHGSFALPTSELKLFSGNNETTLKLNEDYLLFNSGQQTFVPIPLPLVFVGYGIIAPEYDYNDYQSIDVERKIVVFLEGEPKSDDPDYFKGKIPTVYSSPNAKQRLAISRGAAGCILISDENKWKDKEQQFSFEDITLAYSVSGNLSVLLNPEIAYEIFKNAKYSFDDVIKMKEESKLISFPLQTKVSFKGEFKQRDFIASNIVGLVEGSDDELKNSYLIISAHYDHLGIGTPINGDSIYNGAMDNAIGVSVLLELARIFSQSDIHPKRSILFIALTGEEKGWLGSSYYTDHPLFPLHKTISDVNIDGIALYKGLQAVVGVGSEYSTLDKFLQDAASQLDISIENIPPQFKRFEAFSQSDQVAFATAGIPSILVLEGLKHKNLSDEKVLEAFIDYMIHTYHSPFDDLNQDISYEAAVEHLELLYQFCYSLAESTEVPQWKPGSPYINARLRSIAEGK
jgi:hypothetical protein